jgi:hypothetical protein
MRFRARPAAVVLLAVVELGVFLVSPVSASIMSISDPTYGPDSLTFDTATNLEWLDLTLSGTRSYNDMIGLDGSNEFVAGGAFPGFRYATLSEVGQLWIDAGIPESVFFYGLDSSGHNIGTYETSDPTIFNNARALQGLLGYSLTTAYPPHVNAGGWETAGLALDPGGVGYPDLSTCTPGTGHCGGSSLGITMASLDSVSGSWEPLVGYHHWLVREVTPAPVPEPDTYSLLVGGLLAVSLIARRVR